MAADEMMMVTSIVKETVIHNTRKHPIELMDLDMDCLRELCDRLDIELLCALAGTCLRMQAIAQESFLAKKIKNVQFRKHISECRPNKFKVWSGTLLVNSDEFPIGTLKHFGESFTSARITCGYPQFFQDDRRRRARELARYCNRKICHVRDMFSWRTKEEQEKFEIAHRIQENSCDWLARYCSETMRTLHLAYFSHFGTTMRKNPLFANLTELSLFNCSFTNFPFAEFKQLSTLVLNYCAKETFEECLEATFPHLKTIKLTKNCQRISPNKLNRFIGRHSQLTDVTIHAKLRYISLSHLQRLESVSLENHGVPLMSLWRLMGVPELKVLNFRNFCIEINYLMILLISSSRPRHTLEELYCCNIDFISMRTWKRLGQLRKLRALNLRYVRTPHSELVEGIEILIDESPSIEEITIECNDMRDFTRSEYHHIDVVMCQKGISLTVEGRYKLQEGENEDLVAQEFDSFSGSRAVANFGQRERADSNDVSQ